MNIDDFISILLLSENVQSLSYIKWSNFTILQVKFLFQTYYTTVYLAMHCTAS